MENSTSREKILKKVRKALIHKTTQDIPDVDLESDIYNIEGETMEILFAQKFTKLNGKFIFCESEKDFAGNLSALLEESKWGIPFTLEGKVKRILGDAGINFNDNENELTGINAGITLCENLVARTGSIFITSRQSSGRRMPVFPNYHIVLAYTSQMVMTHKEAIKQITDKYAGRLPSLIACITGPSRTADIEKTLVQGAHGPKEICVFLVDDLAVSQ